MEAERPDFEFDEFFYDDEEDNEAAEKLLLYEEEPREEEREPGFTEEEALPAEVQKGVRLRGKITKRVDPESILPVICKRVDALLMYLQEEGLLADGASQESGTQILHAADATMPLNVKAAQLPGASYVLVDALTNQMISIDGNLRIGRDASFADLIPPGNNTVSAQHAELTVKQNVLIMRDIGPGGEGSSHGTFVNGIKIPFGNKLGVEVRQGDVMEFSDAKYRVEKL